MAAPTFPRPVAEQPVAGGASSREAENANLVLLAAKASRGGRAAMEGLCEKVGRQVLFSVRMMYGGNEADVEDIAQEVLVRMCAGIRSLKEPQAFRAWLGRLVANEVYAFRRKNTAQGQLVYLDGYLPKLAEENEEYLPQESYMRREDIAAIHEVIKTFPRRQREAVVLHYYEGMNITQTARAMSVTHQSVMQYLAIACDKVRRALKKRDGAVGTLALLPAGGLLKTAMDGAALQFASGDALLARRLVAKAVQGATVAAKAAAVGTAAKTAAAGKGLLGPLAAAAATLVVTAGAFLGVRLAVLPPAPAPQASISGGITFTGGQDRGADKAHLNPDGVQLAAQSENGALTVQEWWIAPAGDENAVLYSGRGEDATAALAQMHGGASGVYVIYFRLSDEAGFSYRLNQNFRIG